jgi:glycosyltransferase involved in cell wall biosynthesis
MGELTDLIRREALEGKVWLAGERNDVPEVMRSFDVFVLPSIAEGISNTLLEAMASGLPVIATDVGGNPELVDAGRTGLLTRSGDLDGLVAAMGQLFHAPDGAVAMGRAGRARVLAEFSLDAMVGAYLALYRELVSGVAAPCDSAVQSRKALH